MIGGKDVYHVVEALVPLYVSMILAYGSVRWWKIFTPEQCLGVSRFVSMFAVPFLAFFYIMQNDPYTMNLKFLVADSLQKVVTIVVLILWNSFTKWGSFNWSITLFSLASLPNTLIMGVPLLKAMYGDFTKSLMIQIVFLQGVIWNTLLLFMFEYRAAKLLISQQFPDTAGAIASFRVDSNISSLSGREPLHADAEIGENGVLHVRVRSISRSLSVASSLMRNSLREPTEGASNFDVASAQHDDEENRTWRSKSCSDGNFNNGLASSYPKLPGSKSSGQRNIDIVNIYGCATNNNRLHWNSNELPISDASSRHGGVNGSSKVVDFPHETVTAEDCHHITTNSTTTMSLPPCDSNNDNSNSDNSDNDDNDNDDNNNNVVHEVESEENPVMGSQKEGSTEEGDANKRQIMPSVGVMIRLILTMVWRNLVRNPNTYASVLGLVWSLISFRWKLKLPYIIHRSITVVSDTALGMSMFSLGIFMGLQPKFLTCGIPKAVMALAIKFLVAPLVVAATSKALGIRGELFAVEIIQAALPQGIVPFVFAKEYNLHPDILSSAVIFGMVIALPVTIIYYVILTV
uniref:Auxin efflux carrier component n=1 Tax=Cajanus cajan TaxID=3821 RepID=A0A151TPD8_CAJCA|nr:putative auxin efflux carrier component 2 [Cajanus cajan]